MDDATQPGAEPRVADILWRGKYLIAISTVVMIAIAIVLAHRSAKVYEATGVIQVSVSNGGTTLETTTADQTLALNLATLIVSPGVLSKVRAHISGGELSTAELQARLSAGAVEETGLVELHATGPSPAAAQTLGKQVAESFLAERQREATRKTASEEREIQASIEKLSAEITSLRRSSAAAGPPSSGRLSSLEASRTALVTQSATLATRTLAAGASSTLAATPVASSSPIEPRPLLNVIAGLIIGLVVGVGLAWLRGRLRPSLRPSEAAAAQIDVPLLASVPLRHRPRDDDDALLETYELLRANLFLAMQDEDMRIVTITGPDQRVGKTSTTYGLVRAAANGGWNVLVVDGDMRAAALSTRLGCGNERYGLDSVLTGEVDLDAAIVQLTPRLSVLPTKVVSANPASLLANAHMARLCAEMRARYDIVVFDSPPLSGLADGLTLASLSDAVVLVARADVTKPHSLEAAATTMRQSRIPIAGLVVFERRTVEDYPSVGAAKHNAAEHNGSSDLRYRPAMPGPAMPEYDNTIGRDPTT